MAPTINFNTIPYAGRFASFAVWQSNVTWSLTLISSLYMPALDAPETPSEWKMILPALVMACSICAPCGP
jgi:hypothetical protein